MNDDTVIMSTQDYRVLLAQVAAHLAAAYSSRGVEQAELQAVQNARRILKECGLSEE